MDFLGIIMAELRRRGGQKDEQRRRLLEKLEKEVQAAGPRARARPPPRSNRQLHISISLVILVFFVLYAQRYGPKKPVYELGGTHLPEWYAVCSKEGNKVYTVPVDGGVGGVECVVVKGQRVVDTGSLGQWNH